MRVKSYNIRRIFRPIHIVLIIVVLVTLAPILLLLVNTVKTDIELHSNIIGLPRNINFRNFREAWIAANFPIAFRNSLIVTALTIVIILPIAGLAAYAMARYNLRGMTGIGLIFLTGMTLPAQLFIIPLYATFRKIGIANTLIVLPLIYTGIYMPFSTFLLRAYFLGLPKELEDAARVDGCSEFALLYRIIFPLATPVFGSLAVIVGMWVWNEFFFAHTFLHDASVQTVSLKFLFFTTRFGVSTGPQYAAGLIVIAPIILFYIFLHRKFIEGISGGGLR